MIRLFVIARAPFCHDGRHLKFTSIFIHVVVDVILVYMSDYFGLLTRKFCVPI